MAVSGAARKGRAAGTLRETGAGRVGVGTELCWRRGVGREASEPDAWEESKRSRDSLSRGKEVENGDNGEL